jgi:hypothetical protein
VKTGEVIALASRYLNGLVGHRFDVLELAKPVSPDAAVNLAKIVSKLSPLVGNLIEFNTVEYLNAQTGFVEFGKWRRQDPGFPDAVFDGITPTPGLEIKAWFPLATEITPRFKDSQNHFRDDQTYVAIFAWLPESLIFGKPAIIDSVIVSGASVAKARDDHYHDPPDYIVLEPGDTSGRTRNLQQTNTSGYKFQGTAEEFRKAEAIVTSWGRRGAEYSPTAEYQTLLRSLTAAFPYRLDTNFAKLDRIEHAEIEAFKNRVYAKRVHDRSVTEWNRLLFVGDEELLRRELADRFGIREEKKPVVE